MIRLHDRWAGECPLLGKAWFVWVQGCPRRCPGCFNEAALAVDGPAREIDPGTLATELARNPGGLVLSGGEPFAQAEALARLVEEVRARAPETLVLAYSGFTLDELVTRTDALPLLRLLDVLVDGPWVASQRSDHPLVGSLNQRIYLLSSRILPESLAALGAPRLVAELDGDRLRIVGSGTREHDMRSILREVAAAGLRLEDT